jgi:hypothetical protein
MYQGTDFEEFLCCWGTFRRIMNPKRAVGNNAI